MTTTKERETTKGSAWAMRMAGWLGLVAGVALYGCAFTPLSSMETARTLGQGRTQVQAGLGVERPFVLKFDHGLTDRLDVGVHAEEFVNSSLSVGAKYALWMPDTPEDFAMAAKLSAGSSGDVKFQYADLIASRSSGVVEPYASVRWVRSNAESIDDDLPDFAFSQAGTPIYFRQYFVGARFFVRERAYVSLEMMRFDGLDRNEAQVPRRTVYTLGAGWLFGAGR